MLWFNFNKQFELVKYKSKSEKPQSIVYFFQNNVLQIQQYTRNTGKSIALVSFKVVHIPIQVPGRDGRASEMVPMLLPHEIIAAPGRAGDVQEWLKMQIVLFP